jgi:RNA polymerase sigma-B factor
MTMAAETTDQERRALLRAYREGGDVAARDRLIADLLPFARSLARRYAGRGEELDDLVQVASVGLVKAIDNFDLDRDVRMLSYVFPTVVGEIKRHFRDRVWSVSVPRGLKELSQLLSRQLETLTATLGRSPTIAELATATGVDEEAVIEALEVGRAYSTHSLSAPIDSEEEAGFARIDALASEDRGYEETENRALLAAGFKRLDERERKILHLRFFEGLTQAQIAVEVGLSQMHVSRLIRKALEQLDSELEDGVLEDEP